MPTAASDQDHPAESASVVGGQGNRRRSASTSSPEPTMIFVDMSTSMKGPSSSYLRLDSGTSMT